MKSFFEVFILSFFVYGCCYFPGRILIERFNFKKEEKFVLSFAISCFLFYIFGFLGYVINAKPFIFNGLLLLLILFYCFFYILKNKFFFEELNLYFFLCFLFLIFYQSFIPFYSGGMWFFDWFEHYFRTIIFLDKLPLNISFQGCIIPSRPPFFNLVCYFFQSIIGKDFYKYQIISTFLNSLLILSVYLFCKGALKIENKNLFLFTFFILFFNPYILRQITYTWTKSLSAYYTLCGLYFYIKFMENKDRFYLYFSPFLFGCGFIVHYSAGPYILPIIFHFLYNVYKEKKLVSEFLIFNLIFSLLIFTYFSWSIRNFGIYNTFLSNTTFQGQKNLIFKERIEKDINNFFKTIFPVIPKRFISIYQPYKFFKFRFYNYILPLYSSNIFGNLTFTLSVFLVFIFLKNIKKFKFKKDFWSFFILFSFFLALIVNPTKDLCGVAHVSYLPFVCLILSYVIREILKFNKRRIVLTVFLLETISFFFFQLHIFNSYFNLKEIISLWRTTGLETAHLGNFLLKYNNKLTFLYDKFFSNFQ